MGGYGRVKRTRLDEVFKNIILIEAQVETTLSWEPLLILFVILPDHNLNFAFPALDGHLTLVVAWLVERPSLAFAGREFVGLSNKFQRSKLGNFFRLFETASVASATSSTSASGEVAGTSSAIMRTDNFYFEFMFSSACNLHFPRLLL